MPPAKRKPQNSIATATRSAYDQGVDANNVRPLAMALRLGALSRPCMRTRRSGWEFMRDVVLKETDGRLLPSEIAFAAVKAMKQVAVTTRLSTSTHAHPQPLGESITLGDVRSPAPRPSCTERTRRHGSPRAARCFAG